MTWRLLSWFWETDPAPVTGAATVDITADLAVAADGAQAATGSAAVDITAEFVIVATNAVIFIPPDANDPRVAIVTHRN